MPEKGKTNNPNGRPKGAKGKKTQQWEALADSITGEQADKFSKYMAKLWDGDDKSQALAAELYIKTVEYFKPKQARITTEQENEIIVRVKHD